VLVRRRVIADAALAERLQVRPGQQWHEAQVLRFLPGEKLPVASMHIYVRPEHGGVLDLIDTAGLPVFALIEREHAVRIVEVEQRIVAVALAPAQARTLKAAAGASALAITRRYTDAQDRLLMASAGLYPADRFTHETRFRIHNADEKEASP
jgi:DNA-binding GntR family transcriptional regulator